jgi:hypothetical protein
MEIHYEVRKKKRSTEYRRSPKNFIQAMNGSCMYPYYLVHMLMSKKSKLVLL